MRSVFNSGNNDNNEREGGIFHAVTRFVTSFDYLQIAGIAILLAFGIVFVYSTGIQSGNPDNLSRHITWIVLGTILYFGLSIFDYRYCAPLSPILYCFSLILLVMVLFSSPINNARSWLSIPGMGIRLQPSEIGKIASVILASAIMASPKFKVNSFRHLGIIAIVAAIPLYLILIEPDFGSAFVILPIFAMMLFVACIPYKWVIAVVAALIIIIPLAVLNEVYEVKPILKPYQRARIVTFLDPDSDPQGAGYNLRQARLAVGSGGWFGKGIGKGTLSGLGYLPQTVTNNDFIFSVIAEESGFTGVALLLFAEMILILSCLRIAFLTDDLFGRYIAVGFAALLFCHSYINIGMCIGLAPISGLPLPLVSFGGSFMAMNLGTLGILQSIYRYRREVAYDQ